MTARKRVQSQTGQWKNILQKGEIEETGCDEDRKGSLDETPIRRGMWIVSTLRQTDRGGTGSTAYTKLFLRSVAERKLRRGNVPRRI